MTRLNGEPRHANRLWLAANAFGATLRRDLAVTRRDFQSPADSEDGLQVSPQIAPGRSPRRGY